MTNARLRPDSPMPASCPERVPVAHVHACLSPVLPMSLAWEPETFHSFEIRAVAWSCSLAALAFEAWVAFAALPFGGIAMHMGVIQDESHRNRCFESSKLSSQLDTALRIRASNQFLSFSSN